MTPPASSRVSITIFDSQGHKVRQLKGTENKGLNRIYWDFREEAPQAAGERQARFGFRRGGLKVLPGKYTVKVKYEDQEASQTFTVKSDPRLKIDLEVLKANYQMGKTAQKLMTAISAADRQLKDTQKALQTVLEYARANKGPKTQEIVKAAQELDKKLKAFAEILNPTPPKQGIADRSAGLRSQVSLSARQLR